MRSPSLALLLTSSAIAHATWLPWKTSTLSYDDDEPTSAPYPESTPCETTTTLSPHHPHGPTKTPQPTLSLPTFSPISSWTFSLSIPVPGPTTAPAPPSGPGVTFHPPPPPYPTTSPLPPISLSLISSIPVPVQVPTSSPAPAPHPVHSTSIYVLPIPATTTAKGYATANSTTAGPTKSTLSVALGNATAKPTPPKQEVSAAGRMGLESTVAMLVGLAALMASL